VSSTAEQRIVWGFEMELEKPIRSRRGTVSRVEITLVEEEKPRPEPAAKPNGEPDPKPE
jgi:hypothetical protein